MKLSPCIAVTLLLVAADVCSAQEVTPDPRATLTPAEAREIISQIGQGKRLLPTVWPDGKKVAVALTFDLDAELIWMEYPDETSPSSLSRGRYGPRTGLGRILDLLDRRDIAATFFLPALMLDLYPDAAAAIRASGKHEIGYHGYGHEDVRTLTEDEERDAMQRGLALFEKAGLHPTMFRSASWNFSPSTLRLLRELGFRFDSSLMADDAPYELLADTLSTGIIELPVDWSLDDWPYFQLEWGLPLPGLRNPNEVLEIWKDEFDGIRSEGGVFTLTLHPQVIGRWSRIRALEKLIEYMEANDAWVTTLGEIGDYVVQGW
jgi:peptidoglycan/xylan/chitin deacetylase (PgdA/CDA1 family)